MTPQPPASPRPLRPSQSLGIPATMPRTEPRGALSDRTYVTLGLAMAIVTTLCTAIWSVAYTTATVSTLKEQQQKLESKVDGGASLTVMVQQHGERLQTLERWHEEDGKERAEDLKEIANKLEAILTHINALEQRITRQEVIRGTQRFASDKER